MVLETTNKKVIISLKTRKIVDICNILKGDNFEEVFSKASSKNNIEALSKIIYLLAENEEGKNPFGNSADVYDFLDDYKKENNKSYQEIFKDIAEVVNEEGFFTKKMDAKTLQEMMSNPISGINMNDLLQKTTEKAISKMAESQFQGFKA